MAASAVLGRKGLPADKVAEKPPLTEAPRLYPQPGTLVDEHLADQLMIPAALAQGTTRYTTPRLTHHALTNAALLRRWLDVAIQIDGQLDRPADIVIKGVGFRRDDNG